MSCWDFSVTGPADVVPFSLQGAHDASKLLVGAGSETEDERTHTRTYSNRLEV